jgi:ribosomal protein S18 acetylase RimI-like enzyme
MLRILPADTKEAIYQASVLFREYAEALAVDLSFQNFDTEVAELPGEYAPPGGALLLAFDEEMPSPAASHSSNSLPAAGCVALRKIDGYFCEMKRLYVRSRYRGRGVGRALALAVMDIARTKGYCSMRLDTLPQMGEAQSLYSSLGFHDIAPYRYNPVPGARFLEIVLASVPSHSRSN